MRTIRLGPSTKFYAEFDDPPRFEISCPGKDEERYTEECMILEHLRATSCGTAPLCRSVTEDEVKELQVVAALHGVELAIERTSE